MRLPLVALALALPAFAAGAQSALPRTHAPQPTHAAITPSDLMTRLYILADDSMSGREGGTEGNLQATAYIAAEVKRLGLAPAGDSGGYFQWIPLVRRSYPHTVTLRADTTTLTSPADWRPYGARGTPRPVDGARVIFGGRFSDSSTWISAAQAEGRVVVLGLEDGAGLPYFRSNNRFASAAGIALTGLEHASPAAMRTIMRSSTGLKAGSTPGVSTPQMMMISTAAAAVMLHRPLDSAAAGDSGAVLHGAIPLDETPLPARNVVAVLPGGDATLRGEYVALGAHSDHIGIRKPAVDHDSLRAYNTAVWDLRGREPGTPMPSADQLAAIHINVDSLHKVRPARLDSINNGADDDGSGSAGLLEIAQAAAAHKPRPKRSLLFVWHTGEELGLLGSRWFTEHPTVPRDSIVAQLNIDMIGRGDSADIKGGGPRYLELVGSFRLSTELGNTAERVNKARKQPFVFDYTFDAAGHPENIYCRSDHANYARYGIPVIFFTTGLHEDYHQVTDEPEYIDYRHFANVAQYIYDVALAVADQPHRPVVDKPKPADPYGPCKQ
jgi:hypothetical protein